MKTEVRVISGQEVRMEPAADGKPARIVGYAAIYNSLSEDLGGFREMVKPGAFAGALGGDVRGRYNHEQILGRTKAGTLRLFDEPAKGLRYEIDVPDTTVGRDVATCIRRGDVDGSSFCFRVMGSDGESWRKDNGFPLRELRKLELLDVGPVDCPAYLGTEGQVGVRSLPENSRKALTGILTPVGLSTPNLRHARLRFAEVAIGDGSGAGDKRFYVESGEDDAALADACRQAASACDSLVSLSWKTEGMDAVRMAAVDCLTVCQALSQVLSNPDSGILEDLSGIAGDALRTCAKACKGFDHPVARLCGAVCLQAADQCDTMAGAEA